MTPETAAACAPQGVTVIDGGTGSELRRRGAPLSDDVWSALAALTHYELLRQIHVDYLRAGAGVITTNTFATARFVLEAAGAAARFEVLNRRTVQAALEARAAEQSAAAIAGSISCLPPAFDVSRYPPAAAEERGYAELAEALADAGVDLLVLEMLQDTVHARRACAAARGSGLPFWLGLSARLAGGRLVAYDLPETTLEECLETLLPYEPQAVCIMHTPLDAVRPALDLLRTRFPGPIGAYPELAARPGEASVAPEQLAAEARGWLAAGATIVGGCCGTTPAHIRALARMLDHPAPTGAKP